MRVLYASVYGGAIGLLLAFGIAMFCDMAMPDMFFRLPALVVGGAMLGGLMVWLDDMLESLQRGHEEREQMRGQARENPEFRP